MVVMVCTTTIEKIPEGCAEAWKGKDFSSTNADTRKGTNALVHYWCTIDVLVACGCYTTNYVA